MKTQSSRRPRKSESELAAIRERVCNAVRLSTRPLGRLDLYYLCASFASEHYVRAALAELEEAGRIASDLVTSENSGLPMLVYRTAGAESGPREV